MKKMSWKIKVTVWYTTFVIVMAAVSLFFIMRYAERTFDNSHEDELKESLLAFIDELEMEDGYIEPGDEGFYEDDIVFSVYDSSGVLLAGNVPNHFPEDTTLKHRKSQVIHNEGRQWRTYDMYTKVKMNDKEGQATHCWIRAIMYTTRSAEMERMMIIIEIAIFPILVILAAVGGYFITKRAFAPVEEMRITAERIANGGGLRERVPEWKTSGELKRLANTFNGMLDTIEEAFEEEKQFTADASHELRTPVAVIIAQSEYGSMEDATEEERKEALEVILEQGNKMSVLITQLLTMSRTESAAREKNFEKVDVSSAADMVVSELQEKAAVKHITITAHLQENVFIYAEQIGLTRIFVNLIENAIQYGNTNGTIWVQVQKTKEEIVCQVKDDGIGIQKENLQNIFKRFYRVDKVRTAGSEVHAGLGLSMVQILVKNYGGTIEVDSVWGKGTTFTLHFPLYENSIIR